MDEIRRRAVKEEMNWCTQAAYEKCQEIFTKGGFYPGHKDMKTQQYVQDCDPQICRPIVITVDENGDTSFDEMKPHAQAWGDKLTTKDTENTEERGENNE